MNVRPKRYPLLPERLKVIYGTDNINAIECEVIHPPSQKGRTVYLFLDVEDTTDLLRELRGMAIDARTKPMKKETQT